MSYNAKDTIQKKGMEQKKYLKQWVIIMSSVLPMLKSNTIPKAQIIPNKINSTPHQTHTHTKTKNRTKRLHLHISIFSFKKPKINFKTPPKKQHIYRRTNIRIYLTSPQKLCKQDESGVKYLN